MEWLARHKRRQTRIDLSPMESTPFSIVSWGLGQKMFNLDSLVRVILTVQPAFIINGIIIQLEFAIIPEYPTHQGDHNGIAPCICLVFWPLALIYGIPIPNKDWLAYIPTRVSPHVVKCFLKLFGIDTLTFRSCFAPFVIREIWFWINCSASLRTKIHKNKQAGHH